MPQSFDSKQFKNENGFGRPFSQYRDMLQLVTQPREGYICVSAAEYSGQQVHDLSFRYNP